ncbi:DEAD/DEAH box helicase [Thermoflavimicrobium dichotomicum]|uniref:ATP-dependent helicase Lhr and Lhr-like helicase n=1 Tax=Thermoflavimicrobium dichotomicum TaxID=46223 RepID=A0A1I3MRU2_9BACL|nr:DEAD/DEAH box helicase [Thermoflavimicrobium dichotomicum]SFI99697.1 ATP-dependent helicase Lhr and Lhr-like helicase [Thermoflavimicrobium dichotomicum]
MSSSFYLLSKNLQKKIWDMKWESFTPIQEKAIPVIIQTDRDVIISSGTASGKTEAAFLPILTLIEQDGKESLSVLYISPLKALINNQFERMEKLLEHCGIAIHRWHGDVGQSKKKKFLKAPGGILQITPESIESLFLNRTEMLKTLMKRLRFIVIDEIHSFMGTARGVQLQSLISRILSYSESRPRIVGLSATIDNFDFIRKWVNPEHPENVEVLKQDGSDKELFYSLMHFPKNGWKNPIELYEDMRDLTKEHHAIVFCNSRTEVEEATVMLNRLALKDGIQEQYYAHHSSINKAEREHVEKEMATSTTPKTVVATSSLELGIDIGKIDLVVQLDSTYTVSSLKQRLGRSGRKRGADQYLQLYTTYKDSLLQALAVMDLHLENWVEPAEGYRVPYDVLFHQILSMSHENNGMTYDALIRTIMENAAFRELNSDRVDLLIRHMLEKEHLEKIKGSGELIVGLEGERIMRSKEFYSVFQTPEEWEVLYDVRKIGTLDRTYIVEPGNNVILAGKLWKVFEVDERRNKVYVKPATDGKPPKFSGGPQKLHPRIAEKAHEILCANNDFSYINETAAQVLDELRHPYNFHSVSPDQRIIWESRETFVIELFSGTRINQTIAWMFRACGLNTSRLDGFGRVSVSKTRPIMEVLEEIKASKWKETGLLPFVMEGEWFTSKFTPYLPEELKWEMHWENEMEIQGALEFLNTKEFVLIRNE